MRDKELLLELLAGDKEDDVLNVLQERGILDDPQWWHPLGDMRNNQSVVHAQQSSAAAALVEKYTNGLDALLLRLCRAAGIDPRGANAPQSMGEAVERFFGDLNGKSEHEIRALAEEYLLLYATGSRSRPCLSSGISHMACLHRGYGR